MHTISNYQKDLVEWTLFCEKESIPLLMWNTVMLGVILMNVTYKN